MAKRGNPRKAEGPGKVICRIRKNTLMSLFLFCGGRVNQRRMTASKMGPAASQSVARQDKQNVLQVCYPRVH